MTYCIQEISVHIPSFENIIFCFQYKIIYLDISSDIFNVMQLFSNINENKDHVTRKAFGSLW